MSEAYVHYFQRNSVSQDTRCGFQDAKIKMLVGKNTYNFLVKVEFLGHFPHLCAI